MNEETTVPSVSEVETIVTLPTQEETFEVIDWSVTEPSAAPELTQETISYDFPGTTLVETTPETVTQEITIDVIESIALDQMHVSLFGSFLICGTLVGLALLRDRHGN